ncbi:(2Fe-2S)-binding protein [Streptosporangium sp. NPDC000095]|uniref:(2Fe-2S)-binding protein n=1 Tax=Streptosporangium sp. NPDC000095 TaxID=3366184 RepID=UPI0036796C5F
MRDPYRLVGARPEPEFEISVDGVPVPVIPGQSLGAAMHGAGIRSWRTTRFAGRARGLFCGIGVCFDCLVTVNGTPSLRACLTEALPGDRVTTGGPPSPSQGPQEAPRDPWQEAGAGPGERAYAPDTDVSHDSGTSDTEEDVPGAHPPRAPGVSDTRREG